MPAVSVYVRWPWCAVPEAELAPSQRHLGTGEVGKATWAHRGQADGGSGCTKAPSTASGCRRPHGPSLGRQDTPLGQRDEATTLHQLHTRWCPAPLEVAELCFTQCMYLEGWWDEEIRGTSGHSWHRKKPLSFPYYIELCFLPQCLIWSARRAWEGMWALPISPLFWGGELSAPQIGQG